MYDAWKNPETLAIISKIAGVDLVPAMDFEIGHVNLSVTSEEEKARALAYVKEQAAAGVNWEDESPIVDWHTDSYPFVCVTMLSDCTDMVGGETALRKGDGEVAKVRGPQRVSSYKHPGYHHANSQLASGIRCHPPRPLHRAPGPPCPGYHRAY